MKVLILAAGYATRLYPLTKDKAKPLLPVKGTPIINFIIRKIESLDEVDKIYVVTNQKFYDFFCQWRNNYRFNKEIKIINDKTLKDETKLGAIGDIDYVVKNEDINDDLLIVAGDNLFDFNLTEFKDKAKKVAPAVSIGIYDVKEKKLAKLYGVVSLSDNNQILELQEKPEIPKSSLIAVGIYLIPKEKLDLIHNYLDEGNTPDEPGYFIRWLCQKDRVYGIPLTGKWFDIGSIESYHRANAIWRKMDEATS